MIKKIFFVLLIAIVLNSCSASPKSVLAKKGNVENKEYVAEVPFRYISRHIFIDVIINQKKYNFLLDTGAEFTVIDDGTINDLQFLTVGETNVKGNSISKQKAKLIEIPKISISNVDFENTGAIILKIPLQKQYGCFEINGIIGNNLMRKANWQIDYKSKIIRITDNLNKIKMSENAYPVKMNAKETGNVYFDLGINGIYSKFTFDTGSNWNITTSSKRFESFQNQNRKLEFLKRGTEYEIIADSVTLDEIKLKKQIVTLENGNHSLLGNAFFENYILTIDWKNDVVFFDPMNEMKEDKLSAYQLGFSINYDKNAIVVANSWTEHHLDFEVENGTKVLAINSVDVSNFDRNQLCEYWYDFQNQIKEGKAIEIELNVSNNKRKITLAKKQLLPK
jgi:predicted aspartyl protease